MVSLGDRNVVTAAAVYLRPDGVLIVGDPAARRHHLDPERVVREVRRRLGDPTPILLGGVGFDASVLLARMVTDVVSRVSAARGYPPELVMLSRPASWGPFRRELFDNVSQLAGLPESRTITAAEAAATHYGAARRIADNAIVAVLHLGGGTCEVTVLRKTRGRLRGARRPGVDGAARRDEHRRGAARPHRPRHRQRTGRSGHHQPVDRGDARPAAPRLRAGQGGALVRRRRGRPRVPPRPPGRRPAHPCRRSKAWPGRCSRPPRASSARPSRRRTSRRTTSAQCC